MSFVSVARGGCSGVAALALLVNVAGAQPALRLRGWNAADARVAAGSTRTRVPGRSHFLVQFASEPGADQLQALTNRGATPLSYVPNAALSVSMPNGTDLSGLGIQWMGQLQPEEKISPDLNGRLVSGAAPPVLVEFYSDVTGSEMRAVAFAAGLTVHVNPSLLPHHLLVEGTVEQVRQLANWDEVSYIFPASSSLLQQGPVYGCAGAETSAGPVAQAVPLLGAWNGTALGSANLGYAFVSVTEQDPASSVESEIERAYAEWAKYVQVTFTQTSNPNAPQTIAVLFATGAHGDGYPFTGTTTLAHTFYPYPINPEPIAGDEHFNDAETWQIGADVDVFSVALHETGHALGLGHSDNPADVMYPYYKKVSGLSADDIAAVQQLYAANPASSGTTAPTTTPVTSTPAPAPLALTIAAVPSTTTSSSIALSGTAAGGSGTVTVNWSTNQGASGAAQGSASWTIAAIPLGAGANVITVTATDAQQDQTAQTVTVTEEQTSVASDPSPTTPATPSTPATPTTPATNPSPSANGAPPSITILSPATTEVATSASSIVISGTAQSNAGLQQVTWTTSTGSAGAATGTSNWTTAPIPLYVGTTTVMIYATDITGNQAWRSITVTRN